MRRKTGIREYVVSPGGKKIKKNRTGATDRREARTWRGTGKGNDNQKEGGSVNLHAGLSTKNTKTHTGDF